MNPSLEALKRGLADKYIEDVDQKEIFLTKATQYKMWANYIAGLLLTRKGHKEFHIAEFREELRRLLGDLYVVVLILSSSQPEYAVPYSTTSGF